MIYTFCHIISTFAKKRDVSAPRFWQKTCWNPVSWPGVQGAGAGNGCPVLALKKVDFAGKNGDLQMNLPSHMLHVWNMNPNISPQNHPVL